MKGQIDSGSEAFAQTKDYVIRIARDEIYGNSFKLFADYLLRATVEQKKKRRTPRPHQPSPDPLETFFLDFGLKPSEKMHVRRKYKQSLFFQNPLSSRTKGFKLFSLPINQVITILLLKSGCIYTRVECL